MTDKKTQALILAGSARTGAHTDALAEVIKKSLEAKGISVELLHLATADLPSADPAFHKDPIQNPDPRVRSLVEKADQAQMFILLSPIYHNSYSAVLKNALDHLAIKQFTGKWVALGSHGGHRSSQAVDHLRIVARGLNALTIPTQVCTEDEDYVTTNGGFILSNISILERIDRLTDELVRLVK